MTIRAARLEDAPPSPRSTTHGIAERQATFETRPRDPAEIGAWFDPGLPFLVAEDGDGRVVGFARVTPYSERPFYAGVGEHTVYVDAAARGQGLGRRLLDALAAESERRGMYKLTSRIFTTNEAEPGRASRGRLRGGRGQAPPRAARRRVEGLRPGRAAAGRSGRRRALAAAAARQDGGH